MCSATIDKILELNLTVCVTAAEAERKKEKIGGGGGPDKLILVKGLKEVEFFVTA